MKQQKTDRRSQRTYRLVSSAFAELVGEKPYDEILVQDILDRANIGRTTFYAHYFDKEDVLNSIIEQEFRALMRSRAGEFLWEALQAALCRAIEPALSTLCAERRSPPIPVPVVSEYLAGAFLTLLKWWVAADMPYPPQQMENIFQQLALPGVWAMLKEK